MFYSSALVLFGEHLWHLGPGGFGAHLVAGLSQALMDDSEHATSASHLLHESLGRRCRFEEQRLSD